MFRFLPRLMLFSLIVIISSVQLAIAQPGGQRGGFGGGGFFGGGSGLGLLGDEKVQQELELVPDQIEAIQDLQQEMRSAMGEMFGGMRDTMRDLSEEERTKAMEEMREKLATSMKEFDQKANAELLPHQVTRLKQLVAQSQNRRGGGVSGGQIPDSMVEELGITEEQLAAMKEKAEKVRADLTEKMNKLRTQAEDEILSVLDAAQREKYKEMVGEAFEFSNGGGFGGGPGGGRGQGRGQGGPGGGNGAGGDQRPQGERDF